MGVTEAVPLPWAGDRDVAGPQHPFVRVRCERGLTAQHVANFDAFIPVHRQPPFLVADGIPIADASQARKLALGQALAGILSATECDEADLATCDRRGQRGAVIALEGLRHLVGDVQYLPQAILDVKPVGLC